MELETTGPDYGQQQQAMRLFLTQRYRELERALRPWTDGSLGEIAPAPLAAYVTLLRDLGKLWQAHQRPEDEDRIPAAQVQQMLEALEARMLAERDAAVAAAVEAERRALESSEAVAADVARSKVLARLGDVAKR